MRPLLIPTVQEAARERKRERKIERTAAETHFYQMLEIHSDMLCSILSWDACSTSRKTSIYCFSPLTPADWLGRPVSCILAMYYSIALQDVVIDAAVFHRLLISVLSHYGKGDEAVGDPCRDGAAHLWNNQSRWELIYNSCQRGC